MHEAELKILTLPYLLWIFLKPLKFKPHNTRLISISAGIQFRIDLVCLSMEDKPLSPKWFIQAMALLAVAGMTLPLVAGVAGFIKNEIMRPAAIERTT